MLGDFDGESAGRADFAGVVGGGGRNWGGEVLVFDKI